MPWERHELARVANSLLLELIPPDREVDLNTLARALDVRANDVSQVADDFDFNYWARGTLAEVVRYLTSCSLVQLSGVRVEDLGCRDDWARARLRRTEPGSSYVASTRQDLRELIESLEPVRQPHAASA